MTRRMTIIFAVSGLVKIFALYCYTIFWGAEGLREGCVKIMLIVSCLEWLMVEFKSDYTARLVKWYSFFLLQKSSKRVQCSNEFMFHSHMRFYVTQWSVTRFYLVARVCAAPPSPQKGSPLGSPVIIAFLQFLFYLKFASLQTLVPPSTLLVLKATLANHSLLNKL